MFDIVDIALQPFSRFVSLSGRCDLNVADTADTLDLLLAALLASGSEKCNWYDPSILKYGTSPLTFRFLFVREMWLVCWMWHCTLDFLSSVKGDVIGLKYRNVALYSWLLSSVKGVWKYCTSPLTFSFLICQGDVIGLLNVALYPWLLSSVKGDVIGLKYQNVALYPWLLSSVKGDVIVLKYRNVALYPWLLSSVKGDVIGLKYRNVALYSWLLSSVKGVWFVWEYGLHPWLHLTALIGQGDALFLV